MQQESGISQSEMNAEKRQFFRIKDEISVRFESLKEDFTLPDDEAFKAEKTASFWLLSELEKIDLSTLDAKTTVRKKSPELARYLDSINRKIDLISRFILAEVNPRNYRHSEVTLSGGGVSFDHHEPLKIDSLISIEMMLQPRCIGICAYARVVHCSATVTGEYKIGVEFVRILESDREKLIEYVLGKQSEELRAKRRYEAAESTTDTSVNCALSD